jgi:hypothetical protein
MVIVPLLINGKSYENADVSLTIMNAPVFGVKKISFGEMMNDMQGVHGTGADFVSYVNGKISKTGSITLMLEEVFNIQNAARAMSKKLYNIPLFNISVSWTDATLTTHAFNVLAKFKGFNVDTNDGDTGTPIELPLFVAGIVAVI